MSLPHAGLGSTRVSRYLTRAPREDVAAIFREFVAFGARRSGDDGDPSNSAVQRPGGSRCSPSGRRPPTLGPGRIPRALLASASKAAPLRARRGLKRTITLDVSHTTRYHSTVLKTFKCADTEALSKGRRVKRFVSIESVARRKLRQLHIAGRLEDLRVPPGNRLEALKGDRAGQHSIRVNDQFRVCFRWTAAGAEDVEIADYH